MRKQKKKMGFTKATLVDLMPPEAGRNYVYDDRVAGLCLCVTSTGSKTFYVYRKINGKPQRIRIGTFPDVTIETARDVARKHIGHIAEGYDPQEERVAARKRPLLHALWKHWLETHAKLHKRTWKDDERQYEKYLGEFHNRRLDTIKTAEVAEWHGRMGQDHGPVQANRTLALLATLFNAADRVGFEGRNPCNGVKRFKEESRERFLLPTEMTAFFSALAMEPDPWKDFFMLCLFTGVRRGNVASARWKDIDLDGGTWRIPANEAKAGKAILVPLVEPAVNLLLGRKALVGDSEWVFPSPKNGGHVIEPKRAWARVLKRAGIEGLRPHDLRRSLGSWAAASGTSIAIIGAALGHKTLRSTQVYSRLQLDVVRDAVTKTTAAMLEAGGVVNGSTVNMEAPSDGEAKE